MCVSASWCRVNLIPFPYFRVNFSQKNGMWPKSPQWWHQSIAVDGGSRNMRPLQLPLKRLPPRVDLRPFMTPVEDQADMSTWWEHPSSSWTNGHLPFLALPMPSLVLVNTSWNVERVGISISPGCSSITTVKWSINAVLTSRMMVLPSRTLFWGCVNSAFARSVCGRTEKNFSTRSHRRKPMHPLVIGRSSRWKFPEIS